MLPCCVTGPCMQLLAADPSTRANLLSSVITAQVLHPPRTLMTAVLCAAGYHMNFPSASTLDAYKMLPSKRQDDSSSGMAVEQHGSWLYPEQSLQAMPVLVPPVEAACPVSALAGLGVARPAWH
jgi:hypothetical protein